MPFLVYNWAPPPSTGQLIKIGVLQHSDGNYEEIYSKRMKYRKKRKIASPRMMNIMVSALFAISDQKYDTFEGLLTPFRQEFHSQCVNWKRRNMILLFLHFRRRRRNYEEIANIETALYNIQVWEDEKFRHSWMQLASVLRNRPFGDPRFQSFSKLHFSSGAK